MILSRTHFLKPETRHRASCGNVRLLFLLLVLLPGAPARAAALSDLKSPDGEARAEAAWSIGSGNDRSAAAALADLASDPYVPARAAALWSLGKLGLAERADVLGKGLADTNRSVRLAAARGIEAGGQKAFARALGPRLEFEVRMEPDEKDPKLMVERVHWAEPDPAVRLAVIQALAALAVADSIPSLIHALERETSYNRLAIVRGIEAAGPSAAAVCLGRIVPTPYDKEAFEKRMPLLLMNGALAVIAGRLGDERCVPHLLKTLRLPRRALGEDKDLTEVYLGTIELLGKFKVEAAAEPLAALLKETRIRQVSEAVQNALKQIGPAAARPLAANAGDWELAPVFLPLLREPALRSEAVRDTLVKFLANESDDVRREAVETLGLYICEGVLDEYDIPMLEAMYMDPDRDVRQICAKWKARINAKLGEGSVQ